MSPTKFKNEEEFKANCGYEIEGNWYPRVTRIVDMKAKPALLRFYAEVGYDRARRISERSAQEGTAVHEIVERLMLGQPVGDVPPGITPSINAFIDFASKQEIKILDPGHIERRVHCLEHRYAGTLDAVAQIGGRLGVLDIKTSAAIYRDYNLQTSAYAQALLVDFPELKARWILRIDQWQTCKRCGATLRTKGGREKIKRPSADWRSSGRLFGNGFHAHYDIAKMCPEAEHDWGSASGFCELKEIKDDWREDFRAFLGAKQLWEWEQRDWLKRIGYGLSA
ncbi:MAG: hypothetical protein COU11_01625 [Candidatus Harrisonbacteria bacterium CG10_big_fil_rev_8_21_14_0_10_49_15]|uniref:PD-(D/E)XK endonuclease-like domain-containing protein n=1 Tax=Candidatus Harrisonbacteria bacterium CG10_big_fil_rev_8_21_14_0_10_49_15 TaxID=1974587 RepID=A0A2H0ULF1_9BACT|nr:MAG: hypothetical protein COU11_01625 [Candidatus Harrisonbacteria bacterium CG10_big_fil_rev_8_21_14_0_10_49_15]